MLLDHLLNEPKKIKRWHDIFSDRQIRKERFEKLLLQDLLKSELSLFQVAQLLLIRQGHYDQVGMYYDASASAYQLVAAIHGLDGMAKLTNVQRQPS